MPTKPGSKKKSSPPAKKKPTAKAGEPPAKVVELAKFLKFDGEIEHGVPLSGLLPDPYNARQRTDKNRKAIMASLRDEGQVEPLIVRRADRTIIGGNGRYEAMLALEWTTATVNWLERTEAQARRLSIKLNRSAELATWNEDLLRAFLQEMEDAGEGAALEDMGWDQAALDSLLGPMEGGEDGDSDGGGGGGGDPDDAPEPPEVPVTQPGDVWSLGKHTLICGDCLQVLPGLPAHSATLIAADLPYATTSNGWDKELIPFDQLWPALQVVASEEAAYVFTAAQPFTNAVMNSAKDSGVKFRYDWVWRKTMPVGFMNASFAPLRAHETVLVLGKAKIYNPQMTEGEPYSHDFVDKNVQDGGGNYGLTKEYHRQVTNNGERYPVSVKEFANRVKAEGSGHPTQKPLALMEDIIKTHTHAGDTVVDPTAGSGSTLMACETTGRVCVAVEMSPAYCDVARQRWEAATGKKAKRRVRGTA